MNIKIDWKLDLGEGFEDLTQEEKNNIVEAIVREIQNGGLDGSLGVEHEAEEYEPEETAGGTQGFCPICGSSNLNYTKDYVDDEYLYFDWKCGDCKSTGSECYTIDFCTHENVQKLKKEE